MSSGAENKHIKCVVWDLDNTLWQGVLSEGDPVLLHPAAKKVIQTLDERGILQSISSKNNYDDAMEKLKELEIDQYFLYPQIHWESKSQSIHQIAASLKLSLSSFAFVDDQPYEREEVQFHLPEVLCIDAIHLEEIVDWPRMNPRFITDDSAKRRLMYQTDIQRNEAESVFQGSQEEFLKSLQMTFTISPACESDLQRAEELTVRTHQLNATGVTYSYDELKDFLQSNKHQLYIVSLEDKFGSYGKIGLALVETLEKLWTIKLLLMSCRVISRGVGSILLTYLLMKAKSAHVCIQADFKKSDQNKMMYVAYKFAGFKEKNESGEFTILSHTLEHIQALPDYIEIIDTNG